jgi:hypothetical protein
VNEIELSDLEKFEREKGLSATEIAELCPFDAYIVKAYRDKAKQSERMDIKLDLVIPKADNRIATIRYTPLHAKDLIAFFKANNIKSFNELIKEQKLIRFELKQYSIGNTRPIPTKIVQ